MRTAMKALGIGTIRLSFMMGTGLNWEFQMRRGRNEEEDSSFNKENTATEGKRLIISLSIGGRALGGLSV